MRIPILTLFSLAVISCPLAAQSSDSTAADAATAAASEPTVDEVKAFLPKVDEMIASREERAIRLVNEMKACDQRIEAGIKKLRDQITRATDSRESKTRVTRLKGDFIEGLEKAARAYGTKRAEVEESLRQSPDHYTREDLFKARGALDARIDKRVDDIMAVAATFDAHKDLEKYNYQGGGDSWDGWGGVWEDNPEYDQNLRASRAGNKVENSVTRELDAGIDRLKIKLAGLKEQQRTSGELPEAKLKALEEETKRIEGQLQLRTLQRDTLMSAQPAAATSPIGLRDAINLDKEIETTASDLRQDFTAMFQSFRDWKTVRAQLADCKLRRDRSTKWLEARAANAPK